MKQFCIRIFNYKGIILLNLANINFIIYCYYACMYQKNDKLEQIKQKALQVIEYTDIDIARDLIREIDFDLRKLLEAPENNRQEIVEYFSLLIRLKLVRLPLLKDEEIARFFKESVIEALNAEDVDILERVEARQLIFPRETRYEMVNAPIIEAIHLNEEPIGLNGIFVPGEPAAVAPTVKNWLADYDRTYGTQPQKDIVWIDYAAQSRNATTLSAGERSVLRKVLKFYEFLKPEYAGE